MIPKKIFSCGIKSVNTVIKLIFMAQQVATRGRGKQSKPRVLPLTESASRDAEAGIVRKTDREGKPISEERVAPYYNKVTGSAGKDKLQLNNNAFKQNREKKGRAIIFLRFPRVVGTREEIDAQIRAAGGNPAAYLDPNNVIDEAGAAGAMRALVEAEVLASRQRRGDTAAAREAVRVELDFVRHLADVRASKKGQPKAAKTPGGKKSTRGVPRGTLLERYNALPADKVLNVSNMTATGTKAKQDKVPGSASAVKNLPGGRFPRLYSNNVENYMAALVALGADQGTVASESALFRAQLGAVAAQTVAPQVPQATVGTLAAPQLVQQPVFGAAIATSGVRPASPQRLSAVPTAAPRVPSPVRVATPLVAPAAAAPRIATPVIPATTSPRQIPSFSGGLRM